MPGDIGWAQALASVTLLVVVIVISVWRGAGVERSMVWASFRAALQLVAVGLLFDLIFESTRAMTWAWAWVVAMTLVATEIVARRVRAIPGIRLPALAAFAGALGATLVILFGLRVFEMEPVTLVVISGLALGNSLPAAVQAADMVTSWFMDNPGRIESLLALGFDRRGVTSTVASAVIRSALVPQIERTKVIGLIALPGTMTGMLLAGADPVGAVLVQLVIAYLVLGSVGVAATVVVTVMAGRAFTRDLRLADWVVRRD